MHPKEHGETLADRRAPVTLSEKWAPAFPRAVWGNHFSVGQGDTSACVNGRLAPCAGWGGTGCSERAFGDCGMFRWGTKGRDWGYLRRNECGENKKDKGLKRGWPCVNRPALYTCLSVSCNLYRILLKRHSCFPGEGHCSGCKCLCGGVSASAWSQTAGRRACMSVVPAPGWSVWWLARIKLS